MQVICSCGRGETAPGCDFCRHCEWDHYVRECEVREHDQWMEEQYEQPYEYQNLEQEDIPF